MSWGLAHPLLAPAVRALRLDAIFSSWLFLGLVALAAASLAIVLVEQWSRLFRELRRRPREELFRSAPLRVEFDRPARGVTTRIVSRRRLGLAGSPLFHAGLMVLILAGLGRMLFGADAVVHLYEGERLAPRADAFGAQWVGPLARPVAFAVPILLRELIPERYASGALETFRARLRLEGSPPREEVVAVNTPLDVGSERLYLSGTNGCAAFVEVVWQGKTERRILMLDEDGDLEFVGSELYPEGLVLQLRAMGGARGQRPGELEVRALRGDALLALGRLRPGQGLELPEGGRVFVADLRWWARFSAVRDLSTWPAYAGFLVALLGAVLMFTLIPVDEGVLVHAAGNRETVVVAMRPTRLAPLFRERFERLVRDEGGSAREQEMSP